jgi:hypothetical protein
MVPLPAVTIRTRIDDIFKIPLTVAQVLVGFKQG